MKHLGILGHSAEGAALCFRAFCQEEFVAIIGRLAAQGCDAVALVCTEIPLLVPPDAAAVPTLDSTRLLARAAFDVAVGHRALPTWRGGPVG
jgi:aspartate racemase